MYWEREGTSYFHEEVVGNYVCFTTFIYNYLVVEHFRLSKDISDNSIDANLLLSLHKFT